MKTLRFIALICAVVTLLSGCGWQQYTSTENPPTVVDGTKYQHIFNDYLQYQQLTEIEKTCYGVLYTSAKDNLSAETMVSNEDGETIAGLRITLPGPSLSAEQVARVFEAFYLDNPLFFYVDRVYSLEGRETGGVQTYDTLILRYTMNAAQRQTAYNALNRATDAILKDCPGTTDAYLAELYLHDALLSLCTYDQAATASAVEYPNAYSAYGALVEGKAVCEGYAKAMQLLLTYAGIPATVIRGYSADNQTPHMWNLVQINGNYYYLDPTWNDDDRYPHYSYFNVTSAALKRTHVVDTATIVPTDCREETENYFVRNNAYISVFDRDAIADAIAAQLAQGADSVHLSFADGKFENGLLFLKNATLTKKMVNARLANGEQMWDYELHTNAKQNTLFLHKAQEE